MSALLELTTKYKFVTTEAQLVELADNYTQYQGYTIIIDAVLQEDGRRKATILFMWLLMQAKHLDITFVIIGNRETRYDCRTLSMTNKIKTIRSNK